MLSFAINGTELSSHVYRVGSFCFSFRRLFRYTVDPVKRLRQHNGEIKGGAFATQGFRPWEMVLYVYGFIDQVLFSINFCW